MEQSLLTAFENGTFLYLTGLIAASLFFAMVGLREVKENCQEGLIYLALAVFFACAHAYLLFDSTSTNFLLTSQMSLWNWLVVLFAPTLIGLYILFGLFNFMTERVREGLVKTFFGLTLVCYLYLVGSHWPVDVRGILILIWCGMWFNLELKTAS